MRIVFFGTPEFAVASLRALLREGHTVTGVVTQPDRPHGRSRSNVTPPPIKIEALSHGLPVLQPERPLGDVFSTSLRRLDADLGVVVAYGHILRPEILAMPPFGMINVHASVLPALRGAAPIRWAILNGDRTTGISIMQIEAGLDSGPVLHRRKTAIAPDETAGELAARLAELGAIALVEALALLAAGAARPEPQDDAAATFAPKIDRQAARLLWEHDSAALCRRVQAFDPTPGAWATLDGSEVKFFGARATPGCAAPGTVIALGDTLVVAGADGAIEVREVQPAGKRRLPVEAWARGRSVAVGQRFE